MRSTYLERYAILRKQVLVLTPFIYGQTIAISFSPGFQAEKEMALANN